MGHPKLYNVSRETLNECQIFNIVAKSENQKFTCIGYVVHFSTVTR